MDGIAAEQKTKTGGWPFVAFAASVLVALVIWVLGFPGMAPKESHGFALVAMVVILWLTNAMSAGVAATLFVALIALLKVVPSNQLLSAAWTSSNVWFAIAAFGFGRALSSTQLANRITVHLLHSMSTNYVLIACFVLILSIILSVIGMAGDFGRYAIVFPILIMIGKSADSAGATAKTMAMLFIGVGQPALLMVLNGVWLNPAAIGLAHSAPLSYFQYAWYFAVPSLACSIAAIFAIRLLYREPINVDRSVVTEARVQAPMSAREWRLLGYIALAIILWASDAVTHLDPGWTALFVICLMCAPKIGVITGEDFMHGVNWNVILFLAGAFALGTVMRVLGLAHWIEQTLVPTFASHSPYLFALFVTSETVLIHLFTGDAGSAMAVTVPIFSVAAQHLGLPGVLFGWLAYAVVYTQFFFVYQQAGVLFGYGYGLFTTKDVFKLGLLSMIYTPLALSLVGVSWWLLTDVIH